MDKILLLPCDRDRGGPANRAIKRAKIFALTKVR